MSEYRVHRFDIRMTKDEGNLERFLNSLEGDVVSVVPNVTMKAFWVHVIDFVYVVERLPDDQEVDRRTAHRPAAPSR